MSRIKYLTMTMAGLAFLLLSALWLTPSVPLARYAAQGQEVTLTAATPPALQTYAADQTLVAVQVSATLSAAAATFDAQSTAHADTMAVLNAQVTAAIGTELAVVAFNATEKARSNSWAIPLQAERRLQARLGATMTSVAREVDDLEAQLSSASAAAVIPTPIITESGVTLSAYYASDSISFYYPDDWEVSLTESGAAGLTGEQGDIFLYTLDSFGDPIDDMLDFARGGVENAGGIVDFSTRKYFHLQGQPAASLQGRLRRQQFYLLVVLHDDDKALIGVANGREVNMPLLQEITRAVMGSVQIGDAPQVYLPNNF